MCLLRERLNDFKCYYDQNLMSILSQKRFLSGCTCFGHWNELWRPESENIELENVGFSRPKLQIYVPVSPRFGVAVL